MLNSEGAETKKNYVGDTIDHNVIFKNMLGLK